MSALYVVATPIGNLDDFSKRAANVLREADKILAEDTRHTKKLLTHFGISTSVLSLHQHNEQKRTKQVLEMLESDVSLALVTDAGTPGISDPGARLISHVHKAGAQVTPIPGPSSLTAALSVCGFAESEYGTLFLGFLPVKEKLREQALELSRKHQGMVVLFEAPHRLGRTLRDLASQQPHRQACLCRELSKMHEEIIHGTVESIAKETAAGVRGEITLVLAPFEQPIAKQSTEQLDQAILACLIAGLSTRDTSLAVSSIFKVSKRGVYARCQDLKKKQGQRLHKG